MPVVVLPAGLALFGGVLLIIVTALRAGGVPRWAGGLLVLGVLTLVGFNDQDARVLLAIPFGLAWVAVGYALWSGPGTPLPGQRDRKGTMA